MYKNIRITFKKTQPIIGLVLNDLNIQVSSLCLSEIQILFGLNSTRNSINKLLFLNTQLRSQY